MDAVSVNEMSLEALTKLIDQRIKLIVFQQQHRRTMAEVNESIRRNRIVLPPHAKSAVLMLREDRES